MPGIEALDSSNPFADCQEDLEAQTNSVCHEEREHKKNFTVRKDQAPLEDNKDAKKMYGSITPTIFVKRPEQKPRKKLLERESAERLAKVYLTEKSDFDKIPGYLSLISGFIASYQNGEEYSFIGKLIMKYFRDDRRQAEAHDYLKQIRDIRSQHGEEDFYTMIQLIRYLYSQSKELQKNYDGTSVLHNGLHAYSYGLLQLCPTPRSENILFKNNIFLSEKLSEKNKKIQDQEGIIKQKDAKIKQVVQEKQISDIEYKKIIIKYEELQGQTNSLTSQFQGFVEKSKLGFEQLKEEFKQLNQMVLEKNEEIFQLTRNASKQSGVINGLVEKLQDETRDRRIMEQKLSEMLERQRAENTHNYKTSQVSSLNSAPKLSSTGTSLDSSSIKIQPLDFLNEREKLIRQIAALKQPVPSMLSAANLEQEHSSGFTSSGYSSRFLSPPINTNDKKQSFVGGDPIGLTNPVGEKDSSSKSPHLF